MISSQNDVRKYRTKGHKQVYYLHSLVRTYSMLTFDGKQAEGFVIIT